MANVTLALAKPMLTDYRKRIVRKTIVFDPNDEKQRQILAYFKENKTVSFSLLTRDLLHKHLFGEIDDE